MITTRELLEILARRTEGLVNRLEREHSVEADAIAAELREIKRLTERQYHLVQHRNAEEYENETAP